MTETLVRNGNCVAPVKGLRTYHSGSATTDNDNMTLLVV